MDVELAETPQQQTKGLWFRETLAENSGMLFIFPKPQRLSFWMKDASIPLSIAYIQPDGKIVQIRAMQPNDETPVSSLSDEVRYALLVNQGWFERHGIAAGTIIEDSKFAICNRKRPFWTSSGFDRIIPLRRELRWQ